MWRLDNRVRLRQQVRYTGEPIAAMVGLVPQAPVIYVGSFSKTMSPSLRLGFIVLPRNLLAATAGTLREMLRGGNRHVQLAMADFMDSGQFARHLGRMRRLSGRGSASCVRR
jgi:GntR family transcriptional regulator/MocR family aminotransferase